jgi:lipopolysaccharide transport system ATP-binding protein
MSRREMARKFDDIVAFAEVERFIDTQVKHYSSGMYMRLAFAVAAHLEPEILVVDEVLAVGDTAFQKKCLGKMKDVAGEGRTVLFVSHNMQAVRTLCTDAVWLDDGQVRHIGSSAETIELYLSGGGMEDSSPAIRKQIDALIPDPLFVLRGIRVIQYERETEAIGNGSAFDVEISYEVREDVSGLHVYCRLNDAMGVLLFESLHNGAEDRPPTVAKGAYISTMTVPADLLAPGHYSLEIQAGIMGLRSIFSKPIVVQLSVVHTGRVNQAYPGYGTRGMLAPLLPWNTTAFNQPSNGDRT